MDARIGKLNSGKFYAYVNGYANEPVVGTMEYVEAALAERDENQQTVQELQTQEDEHKAMIADRIKSHKAVAKEYKTYSVLMTFEFPSWSTIDGIAYNGIMASSKSDAVKQARKMAEDDGHAVGGVGRYWFKASEA